MALEIGFVVVSIIAAISLACALTSFITPSRITLKQAGFVASILVCGAIVVLVLTSRESIEAVLQVSVIASALLVFASTVFVQHLRSKRIRYLGDLAHLAQMIADLIAGGSDISSAVSRSLELSGSRLGLDRLRFERLVQQFGLEKALYDLAALVDETSLHVLIAHLLLAVRTGSASVQSAAVEVADQAQLAIESELDQLLALSSHQFEIRALSVLLAVGVPTTAWLTRDSTDSIQPTLYLSVVGLITFAAGVLSVWLSLRPASNGFSLDVKEVGVQHG